jgi:hypothetical protein
MNLREYFLFDSIWRFDFSLIIQIAVSGPFFFDVTKQKKLLYKKMSAECLCHVSVVQQTLYGLFFSS